MTNELASEGRVHRVDFKDNNRAFLRDLTRLGLLQLLRSTVYTPKSGTRKVKDGLMLVSLHKPLTPLRFSVNQPGSRILAPPIDQLKISLIRPVGMGDAREGQKLEATPVGSPLLSCKTTNGVGLMES